MIPYYQFTEITLGPVVLQVWGICVALGFIVALTLAFQEVKRLRLSEDHLASLAIRILLGAIVGGRLAYVLLFWEDFRESWFSILKIWDGGMVFYGGLVGAILFSALYIARKHLPLARYADVIAAVLPFGLAIGRLGCHFIRDHMGSLTTVPWGFVLPSGEIRHDTALYSVINGIIMIAIFWPLRKRIQTPGILSLLVLLWYGTSRFVIDAFRATDVVNSDPRFWGLTISQYISAIIVFGVVAMFSRIYLQRRKRNQ